MICEESERPLIKTVVANTHRTTISIKLLHDFSQGGAAPTKVLGRWRCAGTLILSSTALAKATHIDATQHSERPFSPLHLTQQFGSDPRAPDTQDLLAARLFRLGSRHKHTTRRGYRRDFTWHSRGPLARLLGSLFPEVLFMPELALALAAVLCATAYGPE